METIIWNIYSLNLHEHLQNPPSSPLWTNVNIFKTTPLPYPVHVVCERPLKELPNILRITPDVDLLALITEALMDLSSLGWSSFSWFWSTNVIRKTLPKFFREIYFKNRIRFKKKIASFFRVIGGNGHYSTTYNSLFWKF